MSVLNELEKKKERARMCLVNGQRRKKVVGSANNGARLGKLPQLANESGERTGTLTHIWGKG